MQDCAASRMVLLSTQELAPRCPPSPCHPGELRWEHVAVSSSPLPGKLFLLQEARPLRGQEHCMDWA